MRNAAKRQGAPATVVARQAIERWLEEHERALVRESIADYARSMAGTPADLDPEIAAAGEELLLENDDDK